MAQKRVFFPDIDREDRNMRYTIQTQGLLLDIVKGVGGFIGDFFGKVQTPDIIIQQPAPPPPPPPVTQAEEKMPQWMWIAVIGGILLVVLLVAK